MLPEFSMKKITFSSIAVSFCWIGIVLFCADFDFPDPASRLLQLLHPEILRDIMIMRAKNPIVISLILSNGILYDYQYFIWQESIWKLYVKINNLKI